MIDTQEDLQIRPLTLQDADWAVEWLQGRRFNGCEFTFATLYMWRDFSANRLVQAGDSLFFASVDPVLTFSAPVKGDFRAGIERLSRYTREQGLSLRFYGSRHNLVDELERTFPGRFTVTPSEPDFDYLYCTADLAQLPGKAYHSKRNHIAAFSKKYDWQYEPIDDSNLDEVLAMAEEWYRLRRPLDEELQAERDNLPDILRHRQRLQVRGGLIRADGRVVAFTCGAPVSPEEFDVQIEKALPDYAEAYTVINREFAARELGDFLYINRENDVGLEGLRRAKRSYHPVRLIEKFICEENR